LFFVIFDLLVCIPAANVPLAFVSVAPFFFPALSLHAGGLLPVLIGSAPEMAVQITAYEVRV